MVQFEKTRCESGIGSWLFACDSNISLPTPPFAAIHRNNGVHKVSGS